MSFLKIHARKVGETLKKKFAKVGLPQACYKCNIGALYVFVKHASFWKMSAKTHGKICCENALCLKGIGGKRERKYEAKEKKVSWENEGQV